MTPAIGVDVLVSLAHKLTAPLKDAENMVTKASERMNKRLELSMKLAGGGAAASAVAYGAQRLITGFTDSIREVERAKGELATLGVRDLDAVVRKGREMQNQLAGITADAFVRASYDIKSGISSLTDQGVADMTASAMMVAKATKGQAEQMTSLFATSYGIFKKQMGDLTDSQFGEQFGAALSASVQQFKTDGAAMQQAIESAGATAVNIGMGMTEQMALLGMMQQQMQAGEAGTALRAFAASAAKAHEAFSEMKVTARHPVRVRILDEQGQLRAMPDILTDLKARYGETLDAFEAAEISKAFGTEEAMKMINALYGQEAAVRANAEALDRAAEKGAAYTTEMAKAADSNWDATMQIMTQKADGLRQMIGERLLPVVQRIAPVVDLILTKAFEWIDANPMLVTGIGAVVAGLGAVAAIAAPVLLGSAALVSTWATLSFGAARLAAGLLRLPGLLAAMLNPLKLVRGALMALRVAVIATGIGAIAVGLAMAGVWIYKNWSGLSKMFGAFGKAFSKALGPAKPLIDGIGAAIGGLIGWVGNLLGPLDASGAQWEAWGETAGRVVGGAVSTVIDTFRNLPQFFAGLWSRIKSGVSAGWERIKSLFLTYHPIGMIYSNWDGITTKFSGYWQAVKTGVSAGWEQIKALFLTYHPLGMIYSNWDGITAKFSEYWQAIKTGVSAGWEQIKALFLTYHPLGMIYSNWDGITAWFGTLWDTVKAKFGEKWEAIKADVAQWPEQMKKYGSDIIQSLIDGIQVKFEALGKIVSDALAYLNPFGNVAVDVGVQARNSASTQGGSGLSPERQREVATQTRERLRAKGVPESKLPPVPQFARGGSFGSGPIIVGEEGPELRYENRGGFIAHNRALQGMAALSERVRRAASGVGLPDFSAFAGQAMSAARSFAPSMGGAGAIPAISAVAGAGAVVAGQRQQRGAVTYSPQFSMPMSFDSAVDMDEVRATVRQELDNAQERAQADLRRLLHD